MLIAWLEPPSGRVQGDQVYRSRQPCADLAAFAGTYTVCGHWLDPAMRALLPQADVLVLAQCVEVDLLDVVARRRARGLPTVYEINDNFLEPRAFGEVGSFYHAPERRALTLQLAGAADVLQVSTPYLGRLFGRPGQPTWVLENAVDELPPLALPPAASPRLRVGWGGSAGHAADLAAVMPALRRLLEALPEVTLAIMGPPVLRSLFDWVPKGRLDFRRDGTLAEYAAFLGGLHVGLAPLCDTPFNRGRSDVKFLEYAAAGACAVLQRAPAYAQAENGVTAEMFDTNEQLVARVLTLARAPERRAQLRARAHAYVAATRTRAPIAARRHALLAALWQHAPVAERTGQRSARARYAAVVDATRAHATKLHPTRGLCVGFSPPSTHLLNGLLAVNAGARAQAYADFTRAAAASPRDYLPALYAGVHAPEADSGLLALRRAQTLAPRSRAVAHALAARALQAGALSDADAACVAHLEGSLPYPPLALLAHAARPRGARAACRVQRLAPLWPALAAQVDHPQLACVLGAEAIEAIEARANCSSAPPSSGGKAMPAAFEGAASADPAGDAVATCPDLLARAALGVLRRTRLAPGGVDLTGERTLLEGRLAMALGEVSSGWALLAGACLPQAPEGRHWAPHWYAGVLALGAQLTQRRNRPAAARALARRAQVAAAGSGSKKIDGPATLGRDAAREPATL